VKIFCEKKKRVALKIKGGLRSPINGRMHSESIEGKKKKCRHKEVYKKKNTKRWESNKTLGKQHADGKGEVPSMPPVQPLQRHKDYNRRLGKLEGEQ